MWAEGSIKIENSIFHYWVKHYEEPSEDYGIDGGRISKLMLKRNGEIAYNQNGTCHSDEGIQLRTFPKDHPQGCVPRYTIFIDDGRANTVTTYFYARR